MIVQVVANNNSALSKASHQTWRFDDSITETSELTNLLTTLMRDKDTRVNLKCEGCNPNDEFCNCHVNEITFENSYQVLNTKLNGIT